MNAPVMKLRFPRGLPAPTSFAATGRTATRNNADRWAELPHIEDWRGHGGDPSDTGALLAAVSDLKASGGGRLRHEVKSYTIEATIDLVNANGVVLEGQGCGWMGDQVVGAPTRFVWAGAAGGTMAKLRSTQDAAGIMHSAGLHGLMLDCNNIASVGLEITSIRNSQIGRISVRHPTKYGIYTTCLDNRLANGTSDPADVQHVLFDQIDVRFTNSGVGIEAGAAAIFLDGNANVSASFGADTSQVTLNDIYANLRLHADGLVFGFSDTNTVNKVWTFRPSGAEHTGRGIVFLADDTTNKRHARYNNIWHPHTGRCGIVAKARTVGTGTHSTGNLVVGFNEGTNGSANPPTVEAGADLLWISQSMASRLGLAQPVLVGASDAQALTDVAAQRALLTTETQRIFNRSANHERIVDHNGNEWKRAIDGSGNLALSRVAGTGGVSVEHLKATNHPGYRSGRWYYDRGLTLSAAPVAQTANKVYLFPIEIEDDGVVVSTLGARIATAVPATQARLGLYANAGGVPGVLLAQGATVIDGSITGGKQSVVTGNVTLSRGVVWAAVHTDGALQATSLLVNALTVIGAKVGGASLGNVSANCSPAYTADQPFASGLPADLTGATLTDVTTASCPALWFKIA